MGWTYTHKPNGMKVKEFFEERWNKEGRFKILDCAVVKMRTAYMACEITRQDGTKYVGGVITLLNYRPSDFPYDFGYKDMDETMGVNESECPERILKLLSPVEDFTTEGSKSREWTLAWRERCWANINKKKSSKPVRRGDVIKLEHPVHFSNGRTIDTFVRTDSKKLKFQQAVKDDDGKWTWLNTAYNYYILRREHLIGAEHLGHIDFS